MNFKSKQAYLIYSILFLVSTTFFSCMGDGNQISMASFGKQDGAKYVESSIALRASDFRKSNFFIKDIPNDYFEDLNVEIFNKITNDLGKGEFEPYDNENEELDGIREWIVFDPRNGGIAFTKEDMTRNGQKGTLSYYFQLEIDQEAYEQLKKDYKTLKNCKDEGEKQALLEKLQYGFPFELYHL